MKGRTFILITAGVSALISWMFSIASLSKLGITGDGDPILSPLRILNRDIIFLAVSVLLVIIYLIFKKD